MWLLTGPESREGRRARIGPSLFERGRYKVGRVKKKRALRKRKRLEKHRRRQHEKHQRQVRDARADRARSRAESLTEEEWDKLEEVLDRVAREQGEEASANLYAECFEDPDNDDLFNLPSRRVVLEKRILER